MTTLVTQPTTTIATFNNHNMSWTSRCLRLLRRRPTFVNHLGDNHFCDYDSEDDEMEMEKAQQDSETCITTRSSVSTMSSADEDDNDEVDDDEINMTSNQGHDKVQEQEAAPSSPLRVSFDPHVVMVEFDKEEEGRRESMWFGMDDWRQIDLELQADVIRFRRAVLSPKQRFGGHNGWDDDDNNTSTDDESSEKDNDKENNNNDTDNDYTNVTDDGYANLADDEFSSGTDIEDANDSDDKYSNSDNMETDDKNDSEEEQLNGFEDTDFSAFRGLECCLFPHRRQLRRRMVVQAVLAEQQEVGYHDVQNMAQVSQVWSRRDAYRARALGQADAYVVRMDLWQEWKEQEAQKERRQQDDW